ncbi:hypothetical protein DM813_12565 [Pseudomonas alkylphenolica]|uniref:Uncharacterized protein n=1 Tax=Pseudomonas alkylphenolica TaxID=237609 RepID=A0A443ZTK8_9PSED|nr:hypothetical protein [Pseudomonas alkylphenolica]RWU23024.1 hypothetical protein DM813_12565 [Pseudomonas alkylphenolica]
MKYLLIVLTSYIASFYAVGAIVDARLQSMTEDLRHYAHAPAQSEYLEDVRVHAQHSKIEYAAVLGTLLALALSMLVWVLG